MDQNKSIDGLSTHRSKKAASSVKKTTLVKTTKKTASTSKTIKVHPSPKTTSKTAPKTATKSSFNPSVKTTTEPIPTTTDHQPDNEIEKHHSSDSISVTEDFLKPVQAFDFDADSGKLEASKEPNVNPKDSKEPKKSLKKPISKKRKIITRVILGIVILLFVFVIWLIIWGNDIIARITNGQGNIFDLFTEQYEPLKTDSNGRTNILAFGTSGYNMEGDEGEGTHDGAQLTDSIMIISLNQESGDLAMLSLPRDLKASPTCTATGKINEIYWCNNMEGDNEQAGAEALAEEVGDILDIDFQYYAHLNWGSLIQIVNILDGIDITLDEDIADYYYTKAVYQAGVEYHINGDEALGLARARHGTASGDFSRGASQQKILIGIKNKIFEKSLSITDLINLANTLGDNLRTNFSVNELKTVAHLTSEFDFDNMRQVSLIEPEQLVTTSNINGISYVIPSLGAGNYSDIQEYIVKMFSNDPRDYEESSILVLNGTDTPGLAATEQENLESDGYQNIYTDDAPETGNYQSQYILYALTDSAPGTKKLLEEKYQVTAEPSDKLPAGIPREYDFVLIIGQSKTQE